MKKFLTWAPRLILAAYILFISSFALDAFSEGGTLMHQVGDFIVHLTPAIVTAGFLWLAWRFPIIGGLFLMMLGMVFTIYFRTDRTFQLFMMISFPLFLAGLLFIFSHWITAKTGIDQS